ncbi:type II toxin-antitoxin system Phd/YefM family antitoxin [uncultured Thiodictyon sp.]
MTAITYTQAHKHLAETMGRVIADHQPVTIPDHCAVPVSF